MEGYILMDSGPQYPPFDRFVGATRRVDVGEDMLGVLAALAHEFGGLRRDVEIFLSAGLLLFEDNPSELSLLMHIAPCQTDHVGAAQSRQAGEQERPLDGRIFAFCLSEPLISSNRVSVMTAVPYAVKSGKRITVGLISSGSE